MVARNTNCTENMREVFNLETFQETFQKKYLNERYYDEKAKAFNDLKLGKLTIEEFVTIFTNLQRYVSYLKEEKMKVQRFISCSPQFYKHKLEYDNPMTLDESIRREKMCYQNLK